MNTHSVMYINDKGEEFLYMGNLTQQGAEKELRKCERTYSHLKFCDAHFIVI